jgi:D-alanyl-D-alanine carboxypeptidase/D-alanyl-D-alanine-endopeptidase (penicillin-binding protein 4)
VTLQGVQHVDGSGLSRHNLVPPATFVSLLRAMAGSALRDVLPVGGRSGTLRRRFVGTAAEGRVLAKTGTMGGVSGLSGYLLHPDPAVGEVTFSLLGNNGLGYGGLLRPTQDAIVVAVANARAHAQLRRAEEIS